MLLTFKLHLDPFLEIGNKMENLRDEIEEIIEEPIDIQVIDDKSHDMKIEELDLTVRSFNCLKKAWDRRCISISKLII